ncbi:hypothetical protein BC567DRAFT_208765 [Phyllosticta citribraziliensis]
MARAPCWLHATIAVLSVAFFISTLAMIATFPLPHGQMSLCRMFPLLRDNPQRTNTPTSAIDDKSNGMTDTPAAPATPEPRVRTFDIAVSGLDRTPRQLQLVIVNQNSTTTEQSTVPEQQPTHRHLNNKNNRNQQQILRPIQWLGDKRRAWRLQRLREERKKKERAEAVIQEQLTGRANEGNGGQQTLVQRLRAAPGRRPHSRIFHNFLVARRKAKKSNRKDRDGKAKPVVVVSRSVSQFTRAYGYGSTICQNRQPAQPARLVRDITEVRL